MCFLSATATKMLEGESCRLLEEAENVLEVSGYQSFLLVLNLDNDLLTQMTDLYLKKGDNLAAACLGNMTHRLNSIVSQFRYKLNLLKHEHDMTEYYLRNHALTKRHRRFEVGTIAILFSILSFILSSSSMVVTQYTISDKFNTVSFRDYF